MKILSILKDYDEQSDLRIADIFHDVAKGQVLETFIDYTKKLFVNRSKLSHDVMLSALQTRIAHACEIHADSIHEIEQKDKINLRLSLIWLLPELMLRPIYRAFMLAKVE